MRRRGTRGIPALAAPGLGSPPESPSASKVRPHRESASVRMRPPRLPCERLAPGVIMPSDGCKSRSPRVPVSQHGRIVPAHAANGGLSASALPRRAETGADIRGHMHFAASPAPCAAQHGRPSKSPNVASPLPRIRLPCASHPGANGDCHVGLCPIVKISTARGPKHAAPGHPFVRRRPDGGRARRIIPMKPNICNSAHPAGTPPSDSRFRMMHPICRQWSGQKICHRGAGLPGSARIS